MRRCVKYDSMDFGQLWQWVPCSQVSARIPWRNLGSEPTAHRLRHKSTFCSGSPEMDAPFMSVPLFMVSVIQGAFVNTCRCNNCCSIIDFLSSVVGYSAPDGIAQKKKSNSLQERTSGICGFVNCLTRLCADPAIVLRSPRS